MLRLITAGAYVEQELAFEFGQLPPAFLPLGNARLYEAQVAQLGTHAPIHLTVPEDFTPPPHDEERLRALGVVLVPVPRSLTLGASIVYAINYIEPGPGPLHILHGDTLILDLPEGEDVVVVHDKSDDYAWASVKLDAETITEFEVIGAGTPVTDRPVACGYFSFSSTSLLVRALTRARGDFIDGLNLYGKERPLWAARTDQWFDFGHVHTYFGSRRAVTTARAFNTLEIDACAARKSSQDRAKMQAEIAWLAGVPPSVQPYTARLLDNGGNGADAYYRTEYQYAPTLAELVVFGAVGRATWRNILHSCQSFLTLCANCTGPGSGDTLLAELVTTKTFARLDMYARHSGFDLTRPTSFAGRPLPSLLQIAEDISARLGRTASRPAVVMHGDFCFSNILYNSRSGRISVIDPRGYVHLGTPSLFGDTRYDLAKLSHSIDGAYDHIMAGRYALHRPSSHAFELSVETSVHHAWLCEQLSAFVVDGVRADSDEVRAITIALFLSMLPLHADRPDRQAAFIATGLRLYAELEGKAA